MAQEPGVTDLDIIAEAPRTELTFATDKEKAALHGVATDEIARTLAAALGGVRAAGLHQGRERYARPIQVRLPVERRTDVAELAQLPLRARDGHLVELGELGAFVEVPADQPIYHKNLQRVIYVIAEVVGKPPAEAILALSADLAAEPPGEAIELEWAGEGEWKITLRVFRDLGLAFGAALVGIYILLVLQTGSWILPMVIMSAIPLTAIGILPGFWLLNLVATEQVGGFSSPVFFTATAMIGMIALGGIVVRNSVVLIEFIKDSRAQGMALQEAILQSGAVRMRPIVLTALTTALGAFPITFDPIFSGLAWSLIFGLVASTAFSLVVVPVVYWLIYRRTEA
jgi:multidrug efflux pump subunit AcrB